MFTVKEKAVFFVKGFSQDNAARFPSHEGEGEQIPSTTKVQKTMRNTTMDEASSPRPVCKPRTLSLFFSNKIQTQGV